MSDYQDITYEVKGAAAIITLNRPDKLNAYTAVMGRELEDAFYQADADDNVRAIIVTGAGRAFCAGADISGGADSFDAKSGASASFGKPGDPRLARQGPGFVSAIFNSKKPSIAVLNGPAVGVGATLTLPMDIRIAADTARIGFVFSRRGLVPEAGSAWFLPQLVGLSQALRWCISGKLIPADEALKGGLVTEVAPAAELMDRAMDIVREIAENTAPVSVALTRQMLWRFAGAPDPFPLMQIDGAYAMELGAGGDVKEGVSAFLEKRSPNFPGKVTTDMPSKYPWWSE